MTWLREHWKDIAAALGVMLLIQKFMSETLGVTMIGKKIYKGAPLVWRWIMQGAIHRDEMKGLIEAQNKKLDLIVHEVQYNNQTSLKDAVLRIEQKGDETHKMVKSISAQTNYNTLRLHEYDKRANLMTFEMDNEGKCIMVSDAFLRKFGVSEEEVLGYGFQNMIHAEDRERIRDNWRWCCETCTRFSETFRVILKSGEMVEIFMEGIPIEEDEKCKGFYVTMETRLNN